MNSFQDDGPRGNGMREESYAARFHIPALLPQQFRDAPQPCGVIELKRAGTIRDIDNLTIFDGQVTGIFRGAFVAQNFRMQVRHIVRNDPNRFVFVLDINVSTVGSPKADGFAPRIGRMIG